MIEKLRADRGITVKEIENGIYYLSGDAIPIQLLLIPKLSKKNNYWLNNLRNDLKAGGEIRSIIEKYEKYKNSKLYQALAIPLCGPTGKKWRQREICVRH